MKNINKSFWIKLGIIAACLITFITLMIVVIVNQKEPTVVDAAFRDFAYAHRGEKGGFIYILTKILTEFGDMYFVLAVLLVVLIVTKIDHRFFYIALSMGLQWGTNVLLKLMIDRPRPVEELRWSEHSSTSFPSGHSETAGALFICMLYLLYKSNAKKGIKIAGYILFPILVLVVMATRIVLGVHYLSDTVAGASFGVLIAVAMTFAYEPLEKLVSKVKTKIKEKKNNTAEARTEE